jgi:hypothetical protein
MATPEEQSIDFVLSLHKQTGEHLFSVWTKLSGWLVLGNAGALVLLFNAELGRDLIEIDLARAMARTFVNGLLAAFFGSLVTLGSLAFHYHLSWAAIESVQQLRTNESYVDELEASGLAVADDHPLNAGVQQAETKFEKARSHHRWIWAGIGLSIVSNLVSAAAFAWGLLLPFAN